MILADAENEDDSMTKLDLACAYGSLSLLERVKNLGSSTVTGSDISGWICISG